jgi:amidase
MDASEIAYAGIFRQAELIAEGEISSRELVELYLERIARLNGQLNALRVVFAERALLEADQADARRRAGGARPLLGVPLAIKDDTDVTGEVTALGSNAYGEPAVEDAEVVRRLREAGAVILGKTAVPELCLWPFTETATWGVTRNPWDLQRTPGGSSGGSAAAVAAGLVGAASGSDGGGSIRVPAAYCGLFGLKSQRGRVPMAPRIGHRGGLTVSGLLTRSVRDSALFLETVCRDPDDPARREPDTPVPPPEGFLAALEEPPRRLRIAVAQELPYSPFTVLREPNERALSETRELLSGLGHLVSEHELELGPLAPPPEFDVLYAKGVHEEAAEMAHPERLERRTRAMAYVGGQLARASGAWARARVDRLAERLGRGLAQNDVLLTPVTPAPAPAIGACEGRGWVATSTVAAAAVAYVAHWNVTGQPACSVPAGFDEQGMPRAVQLVARPGQETTLLALAAQIEAERPWVQERPPGFA